MLNSNERQEKIKSALLVSPQPISATNFAKQMSVSRQTIVGDIALLRARGESIQATPSGYEYVQVSAHQFTVVCKHSPAETQTELMAIVKAGGTVLDVSVDHPIYGQLSGQLTIRTEADVKQFMNQLRNFKGHLLAELTDGIHSHRIAVDQPEQIETIKQALQRLNILYE